MEGKSQPDVPEPPAVEPEIVNSAPNNSQNQERSPAPEDNKELPSENPPAEQPEEVKASISGKRRHKHGHDKSQKKRHRKKHKSASVRDLYLDMAAAEDSDEEIEENDESAEITDQEAERIKQQYYKRVERPLYGIEKALHGEQDEAEYIKGLEEADQPVEPMLDQANPDLARQIHLPSAKDPSLWFVRCKKGAERLACISLMQKAFVKMQEKQPLLILSVTSLSSLKGHVYIEAYKEAHVRQAIEGLHCMGNKVTLVPIKEMAEIYTLARAKKRELKRGDWVRIKSGTYAGDLGLVVDMNPQMTKVKVKLVPRLEPEGAKVSQDFEKGKPGRKDPASLRPPQRLFDRVQYNCNTRKSDPKTGKEYFYWGGMLFRKGFLYKDFNIKALNTEDIIPTLEELQMFTPGPREGEEDQSEDDEKINLMLVKQKRSSGIVKGDKVRITKGELKDLKGTVISMTDTLVTVAPMSMQISGPLQFPVGDLEKYFKAGDYVRVVHGQNKGEAGLVTSVDNGVVYIYSDSKKQEIGVRASDVQSGIDAQPEPSEKHNYRTNDLVVYNNSKNAGIVLSVERDSLNVLDAYGDVKSVRLQDVNAKKDTERVLALDSMRNSIAKGDSVKVIDGENKGRKGTIVHIYKDSVFLYNPEQVANNGLFVDKRRNLLILGAELLRGANDATKERRNKPRIGNPRHDDLYGKLVRVISGPYKGYQGLVIDVDKTTVKVELSSKAKVISVERSKISDATKEQEAAPATAWDTGSKTPAYFPQSPHWVSSTPAPQSPAYADGMKFLHEI